MYNWELVHKIDSLNEIEVFIDFGFGETPIERVDVSEDRVVIHVGEDVNED